MQAFTRAFVRRTGAACAAAAVLIGGTFAAGAATAAPQNDPSSGASPSSTVASAPGPTPGTGSTPAPGAGSTAPPSDGALPAGLQEAVKRDLGKTVAEFDANGELAKKAAVVQAEVTKVDPESVVSVKAGTIEVKTSAQAAASAKAAAGTAKIVLAPAEAPSAGAKVGASSVDALFADYVAKFGVKNLQSVMVNTAGDYVIRTGDTKIGAESAPSTAVTFSAAARPSVADFEAKYNNVVVTAASGPATSLAVKSPAGDVANGQGYASHIIDKNYETCSIGWNGFNSKGDPAVISAGHCTRDGSLKDAQLTDPLHDTAGKPGSSNIVLLDRLGTFGFSQFGGPGNSPVTGLTPTSGPGDYGNIGTDVSVIDSITAGLNQLPRVTDWKNPANITASGPKVTGVSSAIMGADICKSGRTTGWTCGTVDEVGIFLVGGVQNPMSAADVRAVRGFASTKMASDHGDSGGAVISGTTAVGILSAGDGHSTYSTDLPDALAHTNGYTVKVFVNSPTLTIPANNGTLHRSTTITGKVAGAQAGTKVTVSLDGKTSTVATGANGAWSVKAPNKFGTFKITAQAKSGFSSSAVANFSVRVVKQTLAAPTFTAPAVNGSAPAPVKAITGTGKPGATVELSVGITRTAAKLAGGIARTAVVGANGKWSVAVSPTLAVGSYTVTARQRLTDWNDSTLVTSKFKVVPDTPAIGSPTNGQKFPAASAPMAISGSNTAGATVSVTINGQKFDVKVVGGTWTVAFGARFVPGNHSVSVTQTIAGLTSAAARSSFTVLAIPAPPAVQQPSNPGSAPAAPATQPPSDDGRLAVTGASSTVAGFGAAGGVLLLAGAALKLFRRRKGTN
ncbi:hypothetical protein CVV68_15435 [Arthrobacter livingstonensis]|uniref:Gram-positive cocci surface proteins LPxTG domain-containing protein n=1 Tax=Arthrobacter livingstonensis TaxID=670078 RepID=A0A2V5L6C9_9MICC|nr:S1 family peptidase [Arthrobacter livingstonensis]PYI66182.1 hypothetical protein CVV68_15435 [Arthrobacter livingstonensis]